MRVWRICRKGRAPLDGEGARIHGGRWNHPGTSLVYTSATLSLAALESLVHVDPEDAPADLVAWAIEVPDAVSRTSVAAADLPRGWHAHPAPVDLQRLGSGWAQRCETAVLVVPSALIPEELNYLLNPRHPHFGRIEAIGRRDFTFDPRLWE